MPPMSPALRREFGARPTCVDATQVQRPDAPDLGMLDKKLDKRDRVVRE